MDFFGLGQGSLFRIEMDNRKDDNDPQDRLQEGRTNFQVQQMEAAKALQSAQILEITWQFWIVNPNTKDRTLAIMDRIPRESDC